VAELLQYFPSHPQVTRADAELMLAGIMLDTKSFTLRTGVRTFEAAAYLRRLGADTVEVRRLFASTMDSYQKRASLVSNAEIYKNCAIAASELSFDDIKLVAPQAADELMNISGVEASFVIYISEGLVCCSARSMGGFNVQIIMEKLGGGGHHTMAAAQFSGESVDSVRRMVMEAIDDYHNETKN
jgi:c-di-AMP phosphodiesterase-like protein